MFGHSVFENLMSELVNKPHNPYYAANKKITQEEYNDWQKQLQFDILKGLRTGQSFCNYFGITDNLLYYEFSWLNAEEYIKRAYLEKS